MISLHRRVMVSFSRTCHQVFSNDQDKSSRGNDDSEADVIAGVSMVPRAGECSEAGVKGSASGFSSVPGVVTSSVSVSASKLDRFDGPSALSLQILKASAR